MCPMNALILPCRRGFWIGDNECTVHRSGGKGRGMGGTYRVGLCSRLLLLFPDFYRLLFGDCLWSRPAYRRCSDPGCGLLAAAGGLLSIARVRNPHVQLDVPDFECRMGCSLSRLLRL